MSVQPAIALFIYGLTGSGAQQRTLTLANGFAARGHRVDLVLVRGGAPPRGRLSDNVRMVALDTGWRSLLSGLNRRVNVRGLQTAATVPALVRYLRRERPRVLMSAANHVNFFALLARRLAGVPIHMVVRVSNHPSGNLGGYPLVQEIARRVLRSVYAYMMRWSDAVIAVSHGVADDLAQLAGIRREDITTIYNPVFNSEMLDLARAPLDHPWFAPGSPPVLLGAGTFKFQKDLHTLIRAFARVRREREVRLVLLGEGPERRDLERLADDLGVRSDVILPGFVPNPFSWMSRASVFVLSSAWEGLPGVLIEAMACGCPVVSTNCPSGPAEILEGGRYGPLVPVGDHAGLADAILATLESPPDRERLRRRASDFSVAGATESYMGVLLGEASLARCGEHPPRE